MTRPSLRTTGKMPGLLAVMALLVSVIGCAPAYTTKDLAVLPCEYQAQFFYALEFDDNGRLRYDDQAETIEQRLRQGSVQDVFVFVHGWDKNAQLAERDYQEFICRLHHRGVRERLLGADSAIIVGVFWPSTLVPTSPDPWLAKWLTYLPIRRRADRMGAAGFARVVEILSRGLGVPNRVSVSWGTPHPRGTEGGADSVRPQPASITFKHAGAGTLRSAVRLYFVGHSFGARILLKGISQAVEYAPAPLMDLALHSESVMLLLLNAASPRTELTPWAGNEGSFVRLFPDIVTSEYVGAGASGTFSIARESFVPLLRALTDVSVFNVYSSDDWANRFLFPMMSAVAAGDAAHCALGACPAEGIAILSVRDTGELDSQVDLDEIAQIWNVDATRIIGSHSDLYKGRVVTLLWRLIQAGRLAARVRALHLALSSDEFDVALDGFREISRNVPQSGAGYYGQGRVAERRSDFLVAVAMYSEAIRRNPQRAIYYLHRGDSYVRLGKIESAQADFEHVLHVAPLPSHRAAAAEALAEMRRALRQHE